MQFCALKLSKNTVIKTASYTANLLNIYKKTVFFKILIEIIFTSVKRADCVTE